MSFKNCVRMSHEVDYRVTQVNTAFSTREGQTSLLALLVMHMRDPFGRNGRKSSITGRITDHDEPPSSRERRDEGRKVLTNLMIDGDKSEI